MKKENNIYKRVESLSSKLSLFSVSSVSSLSFVVINESNILFEIIL